jgi:ABC-2 type transport system ATP-binding protein
VREHLELFASYYPAPLGVDEVLETAGLTAVANRCYGALSGGQQQRVLFGLALVGNPDLLFLDEPTVGMDVESRRAFWILVRSLVAKGRAVLLTTHYLEEADALADRVVVMSHGRIIADGTPSEIKSRAAGRQVRCTTRLTIDELRLLPGVLAIEPREGRLSLLTNEAEPLVRELFRRDPDLTNLEIAGAALEDAFLALTAEHQPSRLKVAV